MDVYIRIARRWWKLVVLLGMMGVAAGYAASLRRTPVYEATTTLIVAVGTPSSNIADRLIPDQRNSLVKTYRELLLKRPVLETVIADLGLATTPDALVRRMTVREVRDTQILLLSARDPNPQQAANIVNATVTAFNAQVGGLLGNPYATGRGSLSVVEAAAVPAKPVGAGPLRGIVLATLVSLLLAVAIVFAAEYFDTSVRTEDDSAQLTGLPTLATISVLRGRRPHERVVTLTAPHSRAAQIYQMLRLAVEPKLDHQSARTLIVTSATAGEGKSLTAANLAVALAQTGLRTILIDGNIRRPMIHELFEKQNMLGVITAVLSEAAGRAFEHTIESGVENLRLMLSGPLTAPGSLASTPILSPARVVALIHELEGYADVLIFDSPPVLEVVDTALLARSCDSALLVVEAGKTQAANLLRAREALARTGVELLGVMLNKADYSAVGLLGVPVSDQSSPLVKRQSRPALLPAQAGEFGDLTNLPSRKERRA